ncbi:threonine-phosphate decarboxylase CobD [Brevibacillus humidisoli]|uniref:threonine-phosphate decarboxylase CobD n=1 Tax=Brevibacillus humidisoli TaxID=2895522 RepID=UPI001E4A86DE|nr:threonine-phosphate decarboxylase CobD [Brevibacillus humidisoli]UFJ42650.1 threonine-phosphate decarboxylase CobD [Brevibacillus humidisoli]
MNNKTDNPMQWIERYGHGGDVWTAAEVFGTNTSDLLDYSANINPLGPPPGLYDHLRQQLSEIVRYPDPTCRRLRARLADKLGVRSEQILVGNGAAECIQLAVDSLGVKRVGVIQPCFSEYESAARKAGCHVFSHITSPDQLFLPTVSDLLPFIEQIDLLFLGYPNNPSGNLVERDVLLEMAQLCEQKDVYFGVDEAFLDFLPDAHKRSLLPQLQRLPHLMLFRSMTKIFAIPGLRLGYVIADAGLIDQLHSRQTPWSVNGLAQSAGEWLLEQEAFVSESQRYVQQERERMAATIAAWPGVFLFPSEVNYLLLYIKGISGRRLQQRMAEKGYLIRNCGMYPGLDDGYIRLAVKQTDQNQRMLANLQAAIAECR